MAGTQRIIGYKPAVDPVGWGYGPVANMRGTSSPGRNKGYWVTRIGGRVGKGTNTATTMRYAVYNANKNTSNPEGRLGNTDTFSVNTLMADRVSGANFERKMLTPVFIPANQPVTLAALGTGADWAHGQDHSGATLYERGGLSGGLPVTFGSTNTRPEGKLALWAVGYEDAAPEIPLWIPETGGVSPGHGHSTIDDTPTIAFDFRSTNEALPGFAIGNADKLTKYQVQIWNSAKTTNLRDSGRVNATGTMVSNRRVTWTVPTALPPGRYVVRAQVFNIANTPSAWREWTINIVGAGSIELTSPVDRTNDVTPDIGWSYSHRQNLSMDMIVVRVMDRTATQIIRPDFTFDFTSDPVNPSTGTLAWSETGWDELPVGADYTLLAQSIDTDGQPSQWSAPLAFHLNAPPFAPINREPLPGTVLTSIPELAAMARDADDAAATTKTYFYIRKVGDPQGLGYLGVYDRPANRWRIDLVSRGLVAPGDYGIYEWKVTSIDPHGVRGEDSTWLQFEYAAPPVMTVTAPNGTISTANPTFTWTVDRAQEQYRIQLFNAVDGDPIKNGDSGWVVNPVSEHTFPNLLLRNATMVTGRIDVITAGGVPGTIEWDFDVAYTPPPSVTNVMAVPYVNEHDFPGTATSVKVTWDAVATDPVAFDSYLVRRVNVNTGESVNLVYLHDITQVEWVDDTPAAGIEYEYQVMQRVWVSLDVIPSVPATSTATVAKIVGMVISPVIGGGQRVVLPFWEGLNIEPVNQNVVRQSWAAKPRISSGPTNYRIITGAAFMIPDLNGSFEADDVLARLLAITGPYIDADGLTRGRTVCVRIGDGRAVYGVITRAFEQAMNEDIRQRMVDIEITENDFEPGVG